MNDVSAQGCPRREQATERVSAKGCPPSGDPLAIAHTESSLGWGGQGVPASATTETEADPVSARVQWTVEHATGTYGAVYRREDSGPWTSLATVESDPSGVVEFQDNTDKADRGSTPGFNTTGHTTNTNRFTTMEETHIFSPTLLGKTHFSYNRTRIGNIDLINEGFTYPNNFSSFDGGVDRSGCSSVDNDASGAGAG